MKTVTKDTAYTEKLATRLAILKRKYLQTISADNTKTFDSNILTYSGGLLEQLKAQGNANINGIEISDVESYVRYISTMNLEYLTLEIDIDLTGDWNGAGDDLKDRTYFNQVPNGWDGRNSFVFYKIFTQTNAWKPAVGYVPNVNLFPTEIYALAGQDMPFTFVTEANERSIDIRTEVKYIMSKCSGTSANINLKGYIMLWRRK